MQATRTHMVCVSAALLVLVVRAFAYAVSIQVSFSGVVTSATEPFINIGDELSLTFTYEVEPSGACPGGQADFSSDTIYRCINNVTSETATVGNIRLNGPPVTIPALDRSSLLEAVDGTPLDLSDLFQGNMNFGVVSGIANPVLAFYLYSTVGPFGPNPRLPSTWSDSSLALFDTRTFTLFDYSTGQARDIADGTISAASSPVPEPSTAWLVFSGLTGIGLLRVLGLKMSLRLNDEGRTGISQGGNCIPPERFTVHP
jgi:hypothetical protein